jgi:hypothetical protein
VPTRAGSGWSPIVQLMDRLTGEIVLRKDLADRAGITSAMPIEQRAQALRGRRVAVDGSTPCRT